MGAPKKLNIDPRRKFVEIRIGSVATDLPLPYDIYLMVAENPVLFRRRGDTITKDRSRLLRQHGGKVFLVPKEQRNLHLNSLKQMIQDPSTTTEDKSRYIKESAFVHVHDLFTSDDIKPVLEDAKNLVTEMVSFVSSDMEAVVSLLRLSIHDYYTYNHSVDVAVYSIALARKVFGEDKKMLLHAGFGGLLHDIGKRKLDYNIINKSTALTREEWLEIKKHPTYGREILIDTPAVPKEAKLVVYQHHENFDGTGYPEALKEEDISTLARIVTIADVFDALTTDRSYHKAVSATEALNTMFSMQPGKFDPQIFRSFNKNFDMKAPFQLPHNHDPCQKLPGPLKNIIKPK